MEENFGCKLKAFRHERGLSQIELAKRIGAGKSSISLWERNECEPSLTYLIKLAKFFDCSIDELAGINNDKL